MLLFSPGSQELNDIAKRQNKSKNKTHENNGCRKFCLTWFSSLCLISFRTSQRKCRTSFADVPLDARNFFFQNRCDLHITGSSAAKRWQVLASRKTSSSPQSLIEGGSDVPLLLRVVAPECGVSECS